MKLKRFFAITGIIVLAGMYLATLVFSLIQGEVAAALFRASLICTIVVPVFIYIYTMIFKNMRDRRDSYKTDTSGDEEK